MIITFENLIDPQADVGGNKSNQRLWNFLFISFLLHLVIVKLLIDRSAQPGFTQPYKIIPPLTVSINHEGPEVQAERDSQPVEMQDKTERLLDIEKPVIPKSSPAMVPPETTVILPPQPDLNPKPKAKELVEDSLEYAARAAKELEAQVNPGVFMSKSEKDKLALGKIMQEQQDETVDAVEQLLVYHNQMGDRVYQTGEKCFAIPAVLFLYTFKELNTNMATPVSCGNDKIQKPFSLQ